MEQAASGVSMVFSHLNLDAEQAKYLTTYFISTHLFLLICNSFIVTTR